MKESREREGRLKDTLEDEGSGCVKGRIGVGDLGEHDSHYHRRSSQDPDPLGS